MPINGIPIEILQDIFELAVEESGRYPLHTSKPRPTIQSTPILSSVCRLWREVALKDPLLWRTIQFFPNEEAIQQCQRLLQRSGTAPLDIYMNRISAPPMSSTVYAERFLELVKVASHRWRTVEANITALIVDLVPLWNGETPMLEKLVIHPDILWRSEQPLQPVVLPRNDNLTSLAIAKFPLYWDQWNCTSVTHLCLGPFDLLNRGPTTGELCGILQALSDRLLSFTMNGPWYMPESAGVLLVTIVLKSLKSFHTSPGWASNVKQVFSSCRFPILEEVELHLGMLHTLPPSFSALISGEPPLFRSAKRLTIGFIGDADHLMRLTLSRAFPQVERVRLASYNQLDTVVTTVLSSCWVTMTHLELSEADLSEVKTLLANRLQNYPIPLQEVKLLVAQGGTLYRADYEWVHSHVGRFTILEVRPDVCSFTVVRTRSPFEERLLVEAPAQRRPPKPRKTRAL